MRQPIGEFQSEETCVTLLHLLLSLFKNSPHHHQSPVAADQADAHTQPSRSLDYKWSELKAKSVAFSISADTLNLWKASPL